MRRRPRRGRDGTGSWVIEASTASGLDCVDYDSVPGSAIATSTSICVVQNNGTAGATGESDWRS